MNQWISRLTQDEQEAALAAMFAELRAQNADPAYQRSRAILQMQRRQRAHRNYQIEGENAVIAGAHYRKTIGAA